MEYEITPFQLSPEIINALAGIAKSTGQLEGVKLLKPDHSLRRKNRIQTIQASLAIEGNTLIHDQVTALFDKKRVIGPPQDILEVQNAITAYHCLAEFTPFSMDSLLKAHGLMMKGLVDNPGTLRRDPIGIIRENNIYHEAPHWKKVEPMMSALFQYLNQSNDHLILKSCCFHFQFEYIHPFLDGNGRMGRFWQTRILMNYHPVFEFLPVEHLIRTHQRLYYRTLAKGDDTGDCTDFITFIITQIEKSLKQLVAETRSVTLTAESRLKIARTAFGEKTFSRKDYQKLLKTISTATASRDLHRGVKMDLLKRSGEKRTSVYCFKRLITSSQ